MGTRFHLLVLLVAGATLGISGSAAASSHLEGEFSPRQMCQGNTGTVPGTDGIYSLRAFGTSCRNARKVVRKFHTKRASSGSNKIRARGYSCSARYTGGYEGLIVGCRRGQKRVKWTAYLDASVKNRSRSCGVVSGFYPDTEGGSGVRITRVVNIGCKQARKVMKKCIRQYRLPGWHYAGTNSRGIGKLENGRRKIFIEGIAGGAPHCF